jgi:vanillate O-demethylase monooxygenase subunit
VDPKSGSVEPLGTILHIHAVTPATLHSAHYFQGEGQNFSLGEPSISEAFRSSEMVKRALDEDVSATRLIEEMIQSSGGSLSETLVRADSAAVMGRRVIENLISAERPRVSA